MPLFVPCFPSPCLALVFGKTAERDVAMAFVNHLANTIVTIDMDYNTRSSSVA